MSDRLVTALIKQIVRPVTEPFREVLAKVDEALVQLGENVTDHADRLAKIEKQTARLAELHQWLDLTQQQLFNRGQPCAIYCASCGDVCTSGKLTKTISTLADGTKRMEWRCRRCDKVIFVGELDD